MSLGPDRPPPGGPTDRPSAIYRSGREVLAELADDVAYLALKESPGEALTPSERARPDAARREGGPSS